MKFAVGARALGICDRCGLTYRLNTLQNQVVNRRPSGVMVCATCLDIDQEQLQLGRVKADDAIALRNPRPDTNPGRGAPPIIPPDGGGIGDGDGGGGGGGDDGGNSG